MANHHLNPSGPSVRDRLHEIVFEADTPAGKAFDVLLILSVLGSVIVVMLDSVETIHARSRAWLTRLEWTFTILFTVEYLVRLASVRKP
jgi:voltage-gated potassium channel